MERSEVIAAASKRSVRFRLAGGAQPLILLPVSVNAAPPRGFILDTGAGTTLLSPEFARELNVQGTASREGHTAGGKLTAQLGRVDSMTAGHVAVSNLDIAIVDLSHLSAAVGTKIDGDLGYNFLKHFRLTLDFRANELRLDEPNRLDYFGPPALAEIPIRLAHPSKPLILLDAHMGDRGPFVFAIDTGTSTTAISVELARELNLATAPIMPVTTGGTPIQVSAARLSSLRIGPGVEDRGLDVIVGGFLPMLSSVIGTKLDGIIGYNFLRHYKVVIDYPGATLSLFPR
jgi:predicted aspartyl protease